MVSDLNLVKFLTNLIKCGLLIDSRQIATRVEIPDFPDLANTMNYGKSKVGKEIINKPVADL